MMSISLENMTALVTGASSGIGRATASILARSKARVVLVGRRQSVLEELAMECGSLASAYPCDMTDDAQLERLAIRIKPILLGSIF
jgi:NAD(P)-dependent dehydrogenase (short-subunit alcohol dehydrogenase family)